MFKLNDLAREPAIFQAIHEGNMTAVNNYIQQAGPNVFTTKASNGLSPIEYAAYTGQKEILKAFLNASLKLGLPKNAQGMTLFHLAAAGGQIETYDFLASLPEMFALDQSTAQDNAGKTPLKYSEAAGHLNMVAKLSVDASDLSSNSNIRALLEQLDSFTPSEEINSFLQFRTHSEMLINHNNTGAQHKAAVDKFELWGDLNILDVISQLHSFTDTQTIDGPLDNIDQSQTQNLKL